jgi:hypothetical protein
LANFPQQPAKAAGTSRDEPILQSIFSLSLFHISLTTHL